MLDNNSGIVEVSSRTLQGRYLMRPSPAVNEIILGVLGLAQVKYAIEIFAFIFMSNHFHLLMRVLSEEKMARFMSFLKGNIAKELCELHGWEEKFWGRRYHSTSLAESDATIQKRFRYILENGCKEGLVASPLEWAGVSSAPALYEGKTALDGTWYDRTAENRAGARAKRNSCPVPSTVTLSPLPFLEGLGAEQKRNYAVEVIRTIERETRKRHEAEGTRPLGMRKVLAMHPHDRPASFERSPAPLFFASTRQEFLEMRAARAQKVQAYREAVEQMKRGEPDVRFPEGCFPPPPPFVARFRGKRAPPSLPP